MKIAIAKGLGFAPEWIRYCRENGISYKVVNPYDTDIIEQLNDCDAFMWHHNHGDYRDLLFAKQLLAAVEASSKVIFPNHNTGWHFDDKVGEMYLLQALNLPLVPGYVFYSKEDALQWASATEYPKVFKLRGGAGSMNVILVKNLHKAKRLINKAFGSGFKSFRSVDYFKDRYYKWKDGKDTFYGVLKALGRFIIKPKGSRLHCRQKGYAYFQDFMPGNSYDTRVAVIGGKRAIAFRRGVRKGDFRASGSGRIMYGGIDSNMVRIAFDAARKIGSQSLALDFIVDKDGNPLIVELSYGFIPKVTNHAEGYWTADIKWHPSTNIDICSWMVEDILLEARQNAERIIKGD